MPNVNTGSKTYRNLKDAFGIKSEASCRYLYSRARRTAQGDPATDKPFGSTSKNLAAAVAGETYEYTEMYPGGEGFVDVAEWFETLAKAEKSHAGRFTKALNGLETL